jgi:hypothetical protein
MTFGCPERPQAPNSPTDQGLEVSSVKMLPRFLLLCCPSRHVRSAPGIMACEELSQAPHDPLLCMKAPLTLFGWCSISQLQHQLLLILVDGKRSSKTSVKLSC